VFNENWIAFFYKSAMLDCKLAITFAY